MRPPTAGVSLADHTGNEITGTRTTSSAHRNHTLASHFDDHIEGKSPRSCHYRHDRLYKADKIFQWCEGDVQGCKNGVQECILYVFLPQYISSAHITHARAVWLAHTLCSCLDAALCPSGHSRTTMTAVLYKQRIVLACEVCCLTATCFYLFVTQQALEKLSPPFVETFFAIVTRCMCTLFP